MHVRILMPAIHWYSQLAPCLGASTSLASLVWANGQGTVGHAKAPISSVSEEKMQQIHYNADAQVLDRFKPCIGRWDVVV